jgi:hypothetical protein
MKATTQFKPVELIELHDSGVVVRPQEFSDALAGWGEYLETPSKTFAVSGEHLRRLCDHLDIPFHDHRYNTAGLDGKQHAHIERLEDHEFPLIEQGRLIIGDKREGRWIEQLSARIVGADLLEVLVKWGFDGKTGPEFEEIRISYHGSFTVWWKGQEH